MSCHHCSRYGILYLYNELGAKEQLQFQRHLSNCAECTIAFQQLSEGKMYTERLGEISPPRKLILVLYLRTRLYFWKQRIIRLMHPLPRRVRLLPVLAASMAVLLLLLLSSKRSPDLTPFDDLSWSSGIDQALFSLDRDIAEALNVPMTEANNESVRNENSIPTMVEDRSTSGLALDELKAEIEILQIHYNQFNF